MRPASSCPSSRRLHRLLVLGVLVTFVLGGCASSRPSTSSSDDAASDDAAASDAAATEQQLRASVDRWEGTPYALGGTDAQGIDCSAFVQMLYRDVLGVPLPRTTREQVDAGRTVSSDEAQPGDLVFFRPQRKERHVGVYLGDDEFAHASTSQGVMVSQLDDTYWQDVYWMTRRILPDFTSDTETPDELEESDEASPSSRTGW